MTHHYLVYIAAGLLTCSLLAKTPNLIIILTDDQGYNDVGFNGCSDIPTPHLDQLAANGVIFTDGYVSFPVCGPSRAGLLTGRYQDRFGFTTNPTIDPSNPDAGLPKSEASLKLWFSGISPKKFMFKSLDKYFTPASPNI